jgi:hypothetical protein
LHGSGGSIIVPYGGELAAEAPIVDASPEWSA